MIFDHEEETIPSLKPRVTGYSEIVIFSLLSRHWVLYHLNLSVLEKIVKTI